MTKLGGYFDPVKLEEQLKKKELESYAENFWQDQQKAKTTLKEIDRLKEHLGVIQKVQALISDSEVMCELADEAQDSATDLEALSQLHQTDKFLSQLELARMLSAPQDRDNAFLQINAGAGGTESCDWADILLRMYLRYCERKGYKTQIIDFTEGDGAGYRSVTILAEGAYAYGYLKAEVGVHRLVRVSPFDANKRRHTSFASVYVYPDIEENMDIEVKEADLRVDTFRAGGAGGQKVNKTDSAVRLTHIPSGLVIVCQNERSQHQNRAMAMKLLKARLYEIEMEKKNAKQKEIEAGKKDIAWGSQIRSYVLYPYQMVKDHRTNYETSQSQAVLDGEIEEFIRQYLLKF